MGVQSRWIYLGSLDARDTEVSMANVELMTLGPQEKLKLKLGEV